MAVIQYNFKDTILDTATHAPDDVLDIGNLSGGEGEASTGTATPVSEARSLADGVTRVLIMTTLASNPNSADWPNGAYRCVIDASTVTASLTFGLLTQNDIPGHFARVNSGLTADVEAWEQAEAAFTGVGVHTATKTIAPASGSADDRYEAMITVTAAAKSQNFGIDYGDGSSFLEFPDAGGGPVEVALAGAQPAATGALTLLYQIAPAGSQPSATGSLSLAASIGLAGNQPSATGALSLMYKIALAGNQPSATGAIAAINVASLAGNQPAATGALSLHAFIALAGNQPAPSGAIGTLYLIALAGAQPAATGAIAALYKIALAGNQPAATGALSLAASIALAGNQPAATGDLAVSVRLAGNQPAASGAITVLYKIAIAGDQPAPTGALSTLYQIALAGAQPAASGALALLYIIALAGDQPNATGTLVARPYRLSRGNIMGGIEGLTFAPAHIRPADPGGGIVFAPPAGLHEVRPITTEVR